MIALTISIKMAKSDVIEGRRGGKEQHLRCLNRRLSHPLEKASYGSIGPKFDSQTNFQNNSRFFASVRLYSCTHVQPDTSLFFSVYTEH